MVASWTFPESDEGELEERNQEGVTPMQTSSVRSRRNSVRSWPTTPTTSGGMGLGSLILCTQAGQTEAQDGRREGEGGYELVIFVVVVSFIAIMCYRVVEPAGPEVREVQTEAVETEEDMRRRLLEEVNRTFRLERVRRLQEEREEEERLERQLEQQQRDLCVRESFEAEEEVMTFERRSPSTATESASSSAGGLRRRGQHPLQRELRQLREEAEQGGEPEPVARRGAMVELYHVTGIAGDCEVRLREASGPCSLARTVGWERTTKGEGMGPRGGGLMAISTRRSTASPWTSIRPRSEGFHYALAAFA